MEVLQYFEKPMLTYIMMWFFFFLHVLSKLLLEWC